MKFLAALLQIGIGLAILPLAVLNGIAFGLVALLMGSAGLVEAYARLGFGSIYSVVFLFSSPVQAWLKQNSPLKGWFKLL